MSAVTCITQADILLQAIHGVVEATLGHLWFGYLSSACSAAVLGLGHGQSCWQDLHRVVNMDSNILC
jgi:hypothetical protein